MEKINYPKNVDELKSYIEGGTPSFYLGSRTSTVIPYEKLSEKLDGVSIVDLSKMKKKISLDCDGALYIAGAVSWKEASEYCQSHGRQVLTSPTEELALCLSGVATSATGERCFGFGTLREQIIELEYMDVKGGLKTLKASQAIGELPAFQGESVVKNLKDYQRSYSPYKTYKNAPFPRLEKAIDLMVGSEGQLGIVTSAKFKTAPAESSMYLFVRLPKWEENFEPHLELFEKVQKMRSEVRACEFIDENSVRFLPEDQKIAQGFDLVFLEIAQDNFENVYNTFISELTLVGDEDVFEVPSSQCREFRMNIPRYIFEANQKMKITKIGTDVQVSPDKFRALLEMYKSWKDSGIGFNLFGHFGDAHLHFNFMPTKEQYPAAQNILLEFYSFVAALGGSPFAEHGIGLIKKPFIAQFYSPVHKTMFAHLKKECDPENILFPAGYMSL